MRLTSAYPEKYALSVFLLLGIGGGTITRKLLFAVMLVAAMSLTGIAGASAANVENLQMHTSNSSTVQEKFNTQIDNQYILNNSTTTQKSVDKIWKHVKKASSNQQFTFKNQRFLMFAKQNFATGKIKNFSMLQIKAIKTSGFDAPKSKILRDLQTTPNKNILKQEKTHKAKKSRFNKTHYRVQNISYANYWHDIVTKATAQNKTNKTKHKNTYLILSCCHFSDPFIYVLLLLLFLLGLSGFLSLVSFSLCVFSFSAS